MPKRGVSKTKKSKVLQAKKLADRPRKLTIPSYKSFKLNKPIMQPKPRLSGAFRLFYVSVRVLLNNWKLFGGIALLYLILSIILVRSLSISIGAAELQQNLRELFTGTGAQITSSLTIFGLLVGSSTASSGEAASVYQAVFLIIFSLALVWALRQKQADEKIRIRDSFYRGMYPLIPVIIVLCVIGLQLLPLYLSSFLFSVVFGGGLAVTALEQVLWAILLFLLVLLSLYLISSSLIALYIATLPNVSPLQALRSARDLVRYRRWVIMRKILFLPLAMLVLLGLVVVPLIIISPTLAEWVYVALAALALPVTHSYLYRLYRELL